MTELTRYDHAEGWAQEFMVPAGVMRLRLKGLPSFPAKDPSGRVVPYYEEADVRKACADLLPVPRSSGPLRK